MVVFDASILIPLLYPNAPPPRHPENHKPIDNFKERLDYLIHQLEASREKIVVPTPALSEILVRAGEAAPKYLEKITSSASFRLAPFDTLAAV